MKDHEEDVKEFEKEAKEEKMRTSKALLHAHCLFFKDTWRKIRSIQSICSRKARIRNR